MPSGIEILEPGTYTTVQDYPGRSGYWDIGCTSGQSVATGDILAILESQE